MDRVDRQIIHCLQLNGRASYRLLAEVTGISEQSAARRYRQLVHSDVIRVRAVADRRTSTRRHWFLRIACRPGSVAAVVNTLAADEDIP